MSDVKIIVCPHCVTRETSLLKRNGEIVECLSCGTGFYGEPAESYFKKFLRYQSEAKQEGFNKALHTLWRIAGRKTFNVRTFQSDKGKLAKAIETVLDVDPDNIYAKLYEMLFQQSVNSATLSRYLEELAKTKLTVEQKIFITAVVHNVSYASSKARKSERN